MVHIVMDSIVMACIVLAYIVMAYIVMAQEGENKTSSCNTRAKDMHHAALASMHCAAYMHV